MNSDQNIAEWAIFGSRVPKQEVQYFGQIVILYITIIICLVNLSCQNGERSLWVSLASTSLGILVPNPRVYTSKTKQFIPVSDEVDGVRRRGGRNPV